MKKVLIAFFSIGVLINASAQTDTSSSVTLKNLYPQGEIDAEKHYKKYKAAGTGTLITSLASPIVGLIPAITTSASQPKVGNLGYPNEELFKQADYYKGYTKKAKKIKQRKVWTNWAIGLGVNIVAGIVLVNHLDRNGYF